MRTKHLMLFVSPQRRAATNNTVPGGTVATGQNMADSAPSNSLGWDAREVWRVRIKRTADAKSRVP